MARLLQLREAMKKLVLSTFFLGVSAVVSAETLTCVCHRYERQSDGTLKNVPVEVYKTSDLGRAQSCSSAGLLWLRPRDILPSYFDCKAVKIEGVESEVEWTF